MLFSKTNSVFGLGKAAHCGLVLFLWTCVTILFGLAFLLSPVLREHNAEEVNLWRLPIGIIVFTFSSIVLFWIAQLNFFHSSSKTFRARTIFSICFVAISLLGIAYLLVFFPGTTSHDTLAILKSKGLDMAYQHPWLYILLVKFVVKVVSVCHGSYETSFVVLSLIQIFLTATVYSYCITWLREKNLCKKILIPISLFYIFCPFFSLAMICIVKDVPFSLLMLAWIPLLYDFCESRGETLKQKKTVAMMVLFLILSLLRNNGIYVSLILLVSMFLVLPKGYRKRILTLALVFACTVVGSNLFEKSFHVVHLYKETVGIPLQQVAGVIYYDGKISAQDKKFINQVIPVDFIKAKFSPYSVDRLKWGRVPLNNKFLNSHKLEFLKIWCRLAFPNYKIYIDVYLRSTYGFWSLDGSTKNWLYTTVYVKAFKQWLLEKHVSIKSVLPTSIQNFVEPTLIKATYFIPYGIAFWIFILLWIVFGLKRSFKSLIVGMPIIGNWLTIMVATPNAYISRYVLCTSMALPLMLGMLLLAYPREESQNSQLNNILKT